MSTDTSEDVDLLRDKSSKSEVMDTEVKSSGNMHTVLTGKPVNKKVDHVHKLDRKHSSGDLHSRLKTRKLLGVGETDDGDVHRSKLSQILGHSEQLYIKLPRGLRIWQFLISLFFTVLALWALFFPRHLFQLVLSESGENQVILPLRLYGGAMLGLSVVFWHTLYSFDKDIIKCTLLASCVYFGVQTLVLGALFSMSACHVLAVLIHSATLTLSGYFCWCTSKPNPSGYKHVYYEQ